MKRSIFISATDTHVGKTIATLCLGTLLKEQGYNVGIYKPIQCAGDDALFLKKHLSVADPLELINPYFAPEPLSPHIAFQRQKKLINIKKIKDIHQQLSTKYDIVLIEGAGGLSVPLRKDYLVSDLIKDLNADVIIVSRPGLGTINHTMLSIEHARSRGLNVLGVIFNYTEHEKESVAHQTNPATIKELAGIDILGTIPFLHSLEPKQIIQQCHRRINLKKIYLKKSNDRTFTLSEWDKNYVWHPFTQMKDWLNDEMLIIDQAEGNYLIDTKGKRYLDGVSSLWVNVHGHRKKEIDRAIKTQIDRLSHSTFLGLSNTPAIELSKKLIEISPKGLDKVFYSDNGSTAVEIAIKMAYQYWQNIGQKKKVGIVHLANSYHGDTLGSVSIGGIDLFHKVYRDLIFKTIQFDFPDCYRAPKGAKYPDYAFECLEKLEALLKKDHSKLGAMIVEPIVQGAAGMIVWPKGILKKMAELCRKYDVIFITDEVATGFGRTGRMFACDHEEIKPDIMCLAKGITGGYLPLAATLVSNRIYQGFLHDYKDQKTFFHGHTYTGNPLCCAAALANLKVFEKERVLERLAPKIKYLSKRLQLFYNLGSVGDIRQLGFMVGIELVKNRQTKEPYPWEQRIGIKVCQEVRKYGIILRPLGNVIVLMPPLSLIRDEIDILLDATYKAIDTVTGKNK
ncbi:MAG: adenosylmethionine--8-amino-7-oxononanoate transaminase [Candidatus Omnitrophica bacterium]|nr:adenosylmethionine--8-amino-7-oxononanoate transaminase [Candidatus Omnitrophota bacterium]